MSGFKLSHFTSKRPLKSREDEIICIMIVKTRKRLFIKRISTYWSEKLFLKKFFKLSFSGYVGRFRIFVNNQEFVVLDITLMLRGQL